MEKRQEMRTAFGLKRLVELTCNGGDLVKVAEKGARGGNCMSGQDLQRYGSPIRKLAIMKLAGPYSPFALSLTNIARSSRNAGT